ncbi:MAG: glycosyltransferase family 1 protein [candidate division Zixibacteria bacterium]
MRIAYFTESLPPLIDGVSHTLGYLKKSLDSKDIDYRFYSPFMPEDKSWESRVAQIISAPFPLYTKYRVSLPAFHDLKNPLDKFKPDLIHICSPFLLGIFAARYGRERGIPVVNSFHTRFVSYFKYYGFGWLEKFGWGYLRWFYNRCDKCFVPSNATIRELKSIGLKNLELWSRGIDLDRFSPAFANQSLKRKWSPEGNPIALYVGRLVKEKDVETLMRAHSILRERNLDYRLVFVGDGPMKNQIRSDAPDVVLAGHLNGDDLSRAYASADIFVFPSTTESFGNVALEAAAAGLPSVGSTEGGIGEIIRDGETGYTVSPGDHTGFAEKMESLIKNDSLRNSMSTASIDLASRKSWEVINNGLFENYKELIALYNERNGQLKKGQLDFAHSKL